MAESLFLNVVKYWSSSPGKALGALVFVAHTVLAIFIFDVVHVTRHDGQAGLAWGYIMVIDYPITYIVWDYIVPTEPMNALAEWGNNWGSGDNLRAFLLHSVLGGAQWFAIGWLAGNLFCPKVGWIARLFAKPN